MNKKIITATMIVLTASSSSSISSSSSSASSTSSSQTENIDDRTLAVLVGLQYGEEWFKSALDNPECITLTQSVANSDGGTNSEFSDFSATSQRFLLMGMPQVLYILSVMATTLSIQPLKLVKTRQCTKAIMLKTRFLWMN